MPSKSKKQHDLMQAVKHNKKFAKKVGIDPKVGKHFVDADKAAGKYQSESKVTEGWVKENPKSQEKIRRDNAGKKVKTPDGLGTIKYELKSPTFSQMVPYVHEVFVALDSGKSKIFKKDVVKVVKNQVDEDKKVSGILEGILSSKSESKIVN